MANELSCKFLVALIIAIGIFDAAICQEHHSVTNGKRRQQTLATTAPAYAFNELLQSLNDRVGNLVSLDKDQRSRLESLSEKITQFEASNLALLDTIASKQTMLLERLHNFEVVQSLTKREVESLRSMLPTNTTKILYDVNNHLNTQRHYRDVSEKRSVDDFGDSEKFDALSTLLDSTRTTLSDLQSTIQGNVSRLLLETNRLNRRLANMQRHQQQQQQQAYPGLINYLPSQSPSSRQLITSCSQGAPTSYDILQLKLSENSEPFYVRCDEKYMNGGWTIIHNRYTGELNFQRDWNEYKIGFGNLASEFFIGLEKLHELTSNGLQELVIVLEDFNGSQRYAHYNLFAIGNEAEFYAIKLLGDYDGNAGDSFSYHAGSKFSTFDNDNDGCVDCNCAQAHMGAWWYDWCEMSNLNGKYYKENETVPPYTGMYWHDYNGPKASLGAARMMIRPIGLNEEGKR